MSLIKAYTRFAFRVNFINTTCTGCIFDATQCLGFVVFLNSYLLDQVIHITSAPKHLTPYANSELHEMKHKDILVKIEILELLDKKKFKLFDLATSSLKSQSLRACEIHILYFLDANLRVLYIESFDRIF